MITVKKNFNIQSNLIFILGGLKEHQKQNDIPFNKYGIIHILRQIDDYKEYKPTYSLKELCEKLQIKTPIGENAAWTASTRRKVNRELKMKNHSDSVQIEHVNGGMKALVERLMNENWSNEINSNIETIQKILDDCTRCCYKLKNADKDINANTEFETIKF